MDMKPIVVLLLLSSIAFSTIIKVVVNDRIDFVVDYTNTTSAKFWHFVGNVENTGSVACDAQMKLQTASGKFWSEKTIINPGEIHLFRMPYITNETEPGNVTLYFCDTTKRIGNYSISPTTLERADMNAKAEITGNRVFMQCDNCTFIPLAPKNMRIPITHISKSGWVVFDYPGNYTGTLKFLVFNSTNYGFVEAKRAPDMHIVRTITEILGALLAGAILGRMLNGI